MSTSTASTAAPTTTMTKARKKAAAPSSSVSMDSFLTKSTIYNRHEARRAKTLQNANDTRPALVRVLAQMIPGTTSQSLLSTTSPTATQSQSSTTTTALNKQNGKKASPLDDENAMSSTTTFASYCPPSSTTTLPATATTSSNVLAVMASAAVGVKLVEWVSPAHFFVSSSSATSTPSSAWSSNSSSKPNNTAVVRPPVVWHHSANGASATTPSLMVDNNAVVKKTTSTTVARKSMPFFPKKRRALPVQFRVASSPLVPASMTMAAAAAARPQLLPLQYMTPSMLPVIVLFGSQEWIESKLTQPSLTTRTTTTTTNEQGEGRITASSLASFALAGAATSLVRHGMQASTRFGGIEAGAAVLYFGSYRLVKSALSAGGGGKHNFDNDKENRNWLAIGGAGAVAGSLYEAFRHAAISTTGTTASSRGPSLLLLQPPQELKLLSSLSPFRNVSASTTATATMRAVVARTAPSHALFFVGYEAAMSLLSA